MPPKKLKLFGALKSSKMNNEEKLVFNSIVRSQLYYHPLVRTFCSRTLNIVKKKLYERSNS